MEKADIIASYDDYYLHEGRLRDSDAFYKWVLDTLAPAAGTSLLDVACGEGHLLRFAVERGIVATGIDFSRQAATLAQRHDKQIKVIVGDGEQLPVTDSSFDYVTNLGSLEHFASPAQGVRELCRVLKPSGIAALVLPNSYYLLDIIWHVWRRGYPVTHSQIIERFATRGQWQELLEENGLQVLATHKYNLRFPRSLNDVRWYSRQPLKLAYVLASPITPLNLSYSFLFVCCPYA